MSPASPSIRSRLYPARPISRAKSPIRSAELSRTATRLARALPERCLTVHVLIGWETPRVSESFGLRHLCRELCKGLLGLPVAMRCLPDAMQRRNGLHAAKGRLHASMFFGLRPGCRTGRQDENLALGNDGCDGMQKLHPRRQRCRIREQD